MDSDKTSKKPTIENCPHCGEPLSPWQTVLLSVDRAIVCKNCWYRIILDPFKNEKKEDPDNKDEENN